MMIERKQKQKHGFEKGFTLVETLIVTLLLSVVLAAGSMVFIAGHSAFSNTNIRAILQENSRRTLQRIAFELQESGMDQNNNLKVSILNGSGSNGTDILRFSIPLCVCYSSSIDSSGNVSRWGAPLVWGQPGCSTAYPVGGGGNVDICHIPPANPSNPTSLNVSVNAVKAHLGHGDYVGTCGSCNPSIYNRTVEYSINSSGQLLRKVLDLNGSAVASVVMAQNLVDFQASLNAAQTVVTVTVH